MSAQMVQERLKYLLGPLGTLKAIVCDPDVHGLREGVWNTLEAHECWRQIAHCGYMRCIYALVEKENKNFYLVVTAAVLPQDGKIIKGHGLSCAF
jgi:hypothetical protein